MPRLSLSSLTPHPNLQKRAFAGDFGGQYCEEAVADYADAIQRGDKLPPIDVFEVPGGHRLIADGYQRFKAHQRAGKSRIACTVHEGDFADAELFSIGANKSHGLRRTNADKRRAVEAALKNKKSKGWSDRRIAGHVGVSQPFVGRIRSTDNGYQSDAPRVGADGKTRKPPSKPKSKAKAKAVGNGRLAVEPPQEADPEPAFDAGKQGAEREKQAKKAGSKGDLHEDFGQFLNAIEKPTWQWIHALAHLEMTSHLIELRDVFQRLADAAADSIPASRAEEKAKALPPGKSRGKGIRYGHAAVDQLKKIPLNDGLRKRAFAMVRQWMRHNP